MHSSPDRSCHRHILRCHCWLHSHCYQWLLPLLDTACTSCPVEDIYLYITYYSRNTWLFKTRTCTSPLTSEYGESEYFSVCPLNYSQRCFGWLRAKVNKLINALYHYILSQLSFTLLNLVISSLKSFQCIPTTQIISLKL